MLSKAIIHILAKFPKAQKSVLAQLTEPPQHPDIELKYVYTDKEGNNYYQPADITKIPYQRALAADMAMKYVEMGITKAEFLRIYTRIKESANAGNFVEAFSLLSEIESRMKWNAEEDTLMQLATVYYYLEDEKPDSFDKNIQAKKIKLWKADLEAKAFFLQKCWETMNNSGELSEIDINTYLAMKDQFKDLLNSQTT